MTLNLRQLKDMRRKYGLTQYDMSIFVGVSDVAYRTWEKRVRKPRANHIDKLNEIFNILSENENAVGNRDLSVDILNEVLFIE